MIEVEIKANLDKEKNLDAFEQHLSQIGAKYLKTIDQTDIYFQHPKKDFKKTDEALRIRMEENNCILTYKGAKLENKSKTREEIEVFFNDQLKMRKILENLGFWAVLEVKKTRKKYSLNNVEISIDKVKNLGNFIELETKVKNEENISEAVNLLIEKIKMLGISEERLERKSYLELLLKKFRISK
ncbi:MAG: class IV adenylate cyclase [Candidatus Helarchaeota archaeon]